jgi:hypothetical protein
MTEIIRVSNFLRNALLVDATLGLISGFLLAFGANSLQTVLGLPYSILFYSGLSFFPFAALLFYAATRKTISKTIIWIIIGLNFLWGIDSFLILISGYIEPTNIGFIFVIAQSIGVLAFGILEFIGLRNSEIVVFTDAKQTI